MFYSSVPNQMLGKRRKYKGQYDLNHWGQNFPKAKADHCLLGFECTLIAQCICDASSLRKETAGV